MPFIQVKLRLCFSCASGRLRHTVDREVTWAAPLLYPALSDGMAAPTHTDYFAMHETRLIFNCLHMPF